MLKVSEIVKYIENEMAIKLSDTQIDILRHIINGDVIYTPRGCGRSMLYDGYADYLKKVVGATTDFSVDPLDFDAVYTPDDFTYSGLCVCSDIKNSDPDFYNKEYNCCYDVSDRG